MVQKRKKRFNYKLWLPVLAVLALLVVLIFTLRAPKKVATIPSTNPVSNSSQPNSSNQPSGSTSQNSSTQNSPSSTKSSSSPAVSSSGAGPITPYGDFVSSHHVSGSTAMYSVCNTSAGATCYIEFTNGSLVRKLATQITDSNGATYWYWSTATSSLSAGSWTITAVATLNGQTKTATDAQPLVVQ